MFDYVARSQFKVPAPQGERVVSKGEALRLSSLKATAGVQRGILLEKNVSSLQDILSTTESRVRTLIDKLHLSPELASKRSIRLALSLLARHESLKSFRPPTQEFLEEVAEFNRIATGTNAISKISSKNGAGEWAGYNCNIGKGCSHGCIYCYAEKRASRYKQIESQEAWRQELFRKVKTAKCKKYSEPIMFPTTHDITEAYLPAYRCHLYNILKAGNEVVLVTKPHRASIEAICSEFSSFRDNMIFRFSIGGLDNEAMKIWEPGAPDLSERLWCLQYAFEQGFKTSVSAEPMLADRQGAEKMYYTVEPLVTEDIWFGKMNNVGSFRKSENPEVSSRAMELYAAYSDSEILKLVASIGGMPKVEWKDTVKKVIAKQNIKNGGI
jgi:DNA repair photolyase